MDITLPSEVLIQVAEYLNPADLATACCVNRTWFIPFASRLWRSLHKDQFAQEALLEALPRYSSFVRELRSSRFGKLRQVGPECTRLNLIDVPVLLPEQEDGCALEILERNPDLEDISVLFLSQVEASQLLMRFVGIVVGMKKLKKLSIHGFIAPAMTLEYLLEMLPGLKELSVVFCLNAPPDAVLDPDFVAWREKKEVAMVHKADNGNRTVAAVTIDGATASTTGATASTTGATASTTGATTKSTSQQRELRKLSLAGMELTFESLLKIVQNYPLLESLVLEGPDQFDPFRPNSPSFIPFCEQLRVFCPRLDQLSLKSVEISNEGLELLLTAFPRLKRIAIAETSMQDCDILQVLLDHQGYTETLEEIDLTQDSFPRSSAQETLEVLRKYRRLRRLRVTDGTVMAEALVQLLRGSNDEQQGQQQLQEHLLATSQGSGQEGQDPLSHGHDAGRPGQFLERLDVTIVGPSRSWAPSRHYHEERSQEMEEQDQQQQQHDDDEERTYPLFDTLMSLLRERTLLDVDSWMEYIPFDYEL
ncbi:hypothetical protein BGZ95_005904 [Linnemannia exigua]|uniref:F-box domain-containing protein n=1 Tax=Linnemannia exigua TaxID=604196 RepID=A0AAD4D3I2_9FUNG|nr:hypothetical protein BGZ95_005904 [Linnemannia exigua]